MADEDSIFAKAGFSLPTAKPQASAAPDPASSGTKSIFEAAGFKLPTGAPPPADEPWKDAEALENLAAQGVHGTPETPKKPGRGILQALKDYPGHVISGLMETLAGPGNVLASKTPSTSESLIPAAANLAGLTVGTEFPKVGAAATIEKVGPTAQSVNALVKAIGPENVPEVVNRLKSNPRLAIADVSDPVRTMAQGLIDPAQPKAQKVISDVVKERVKGATQAANDAYTEAMGPSPNVPAMVEGLKERARAAGREAIQPALANAKAVDVSPVIAAIDEKLQPGIHAMLDPKTQLPLSDLQQELLRFKQELTAPTGETLFDPMRLHRVQSDMGDRAFQLSQSASGKERNLGKELRNFNEKLIDQIDEASKVGKEVSASGLRVADSTIDYLTPAEKKMGLKVHDILDKEGNIRGTVTVNQADPKVLHIDDISSPTGPNSMGGAEVRSILKQLKSRYPEAETITGNRVSGARFGGTKVPVSEGSIAEANIAAKTSSSEPGPYRQARQKFKDAKDISEAFESGFDTLKNRQGLKGALEDTPDALRNWMKEATPEEVVARRLGTRSDIAQKINGVKNGALAGETITRIEYNKEKLRILFGEKEANRLIRNMEDAADMATTNAKILAGAKTAETLAGRKALEVPKIGGGNPLNYVAPAIAEVMGQSAGMPFVGAGLSLAGKGAHMGVQKLSQMNALARNESFAKGALATGPAREETIRRLLVHPSVRRALKKSSNALTAP